MNSPFNFSFNRFFILDFQHQMHASLEVKTQIDFFMGPGVEKSWDKTNN
jgi:hypothetical protein